MDAPPAGTPSGQPPPTLPHGLAHHMFELGQPALPAVVEQAERNDDQAEGADDHQHHEERPVVAARRAGPRLAAAGGGVTLDANLGGGPGALARALGCQAALGPMGLGFTLGTCVGRGPCPSPPPSPEGPSLLLQARRGSDPTVVDVRPHTHLGVPNPPEATRELAVTEHTAPPAWAQTGQLGASGLSPLHTRPTRLRKLSSHLGVGVHVLGCPPASSAHRNGSVVSLSWPSSLCPGPRPLGWADSPVSAQAQGAEKVRCHPQMTGARVGGGAENQLIIL